MDIYQLTRKKRPTHLTLGQSTSIRPPLSALDTIDSPTLTEQSSIDSKRQSLTSASSSFCEHVTGPPARHHWKPDADATHCAQFGCRTSFGLIDRRHHCRKCGDIFCAVHCSQLIRLDQTSRFHPKGIVSRCCDGCASDYHRWQAGLKDTHEQQQQQQQQEEDEDEDSGCKEKSRRRAGIMTHQPHAMEGVTELGRDDIVEANRHPIVIKSKPEGAVVFNPIPSVPADWQWSTF